MNYLEQTNFLTVDDFVKAFNKHRSSNKNKWICALAQVGDKKVGIKSFNTSIQIFKVNELSCPSTYDLTVCDWKTYLKTYIEA